MNLLIAAALLFGSPIHYSLSTANGVVSFNSDVIITSPTILVPEKGSTLFGEDVDLISVDPTAYLGAWIQATTRSGLKFMWLFNNRDMRKRQSTVTGRQATLSVSPFGKVGA